MAGTDGGAPGCGLVLPRDPGGFRSGTGLERQAVECEREMAKRLACLALQGKEGVDYKGTVSGITDFGIFMEFADMPAEGLIPIESLGDDWFETDTVTQSITATHSHKKWILGQPIIARLTSVNLERQEIRLVPVEPGPAIRRTKFKRRPRVSAFNSETPKTQRKRRR